MKNVIAIAFVAAIAAACAYTRSFPRFVQIAPDSTGFRIRGGKIIAIVEPGYSYVHPFDEIVPIKTGLAVDRYRTRARLRDGTWWSFDVVFMNRWKNTTDAEKKQTFTNWYAQHRHSGAPISKLNPEGSVEVEVLRAAMDQYVPCLLGTLTMTDVVDTTAGALTAISHRLLHALQHQPIEITSVRIIPDSFESSHSDAISDRFFTWTRVWMRGKRVSGRDTCLKYIPAAPLLPIVGMGVSIV